MIRRTEAILAATAETVDLSKAVPGAAANIIQKHETSHTLAISNGTANPLYIKFNWKTGDTEVSATNFDLAIPAGSPFQIGPMPLAIDNLRVISAGAGNIGLIAF